MSPVQDHHFQRLLVAERHEALRRVAGDSRLRRQFARERRRRRRAGPAR